MHFIEINVKTLQFKSLKRRHCLHAITFAAYRHNVNVLLSNSTFLIFALLVVWWQWCRPCRR